MRYVDLVKEHAITCRWISANAKSFVMLSPARPSKWVAMKAAVLIWFDRINDGRE